MEPTTDPPPFWSPPLPMRRRRSSSPPFISLPVLIILLPTLALIILFFAIRPLLSLTPQVFRPSSVKKSWDSFNVFLVLFAIICGIFARRNDDVPTAAADVGDRGGSDRRTVDAAGAKVNGNSEFPQQWFGFSDRRFSDPAGRTPAVTTTRLRRNSSYPDLRQESPWETGNDRNQFRFFDDFEINKFRSRSFEYRLRGSEIEESPPAEIKVISVDSSPAPQRLKSPNPPPPPPLPVTQRKSRRTYQTIQKQAEVQEVSGSTNNAEFVKSQTPPPPPPLPPRTVIPPSPVRVRLEERFGKNERKKTNVKKEIKMALASLYRMRKKKQKAKSIYDSDRRSLTEQRPPPPPPPPPPSVFRMFKKSSKNKRVHSESTPPPPPPPPPPVSSSSRPTKNKIQIPPPPSPPPPPSSQQRNSFTNRRPPLPARVHNSYTENESINSGAKNPSVTIPPPPPPLPTTDVKCGVRGDTIESRSSETSRCGSPEPENVDPSSIKDTPEPTVGMNGGSGGVGTVFCPSPDVNIKAANFIARLRGEWKLEKMNSVREKERLGHGPNYEVMGQGPNV